jgi:hypothetical protein
MITAVYVSAKETFEQVFRALEHEAQSAWAIARVYLAGSNDDEIVVETGMRGREIHLKMYQGSSFSVKLEGLNLVRCRRSSGAALWLRPDGQLSRTEVQWHVPDRETGRFVGEVLATIRADALPLYRDSLGTFVMCGDCPNQLECLARN